MAGDIVKQMPYEMLAEVTRCVDSLRNATRHDDDIADGEDEEETIRTNAEKFSEQLKPFGLTPGDVLQAYRTEKKYRPDLKAKSFLSIG
jgi:hypothetical protein